MWELDYKESWWPKNWCFELWCWRSFLRVPWTARRSDQSILKEISPRHSLEGLMLKLKLQYFGHLMWRADSFEKTLMLGKIEGSPDISNFLEEISSLFYCLISSISLHCSFKKALSLLALFWISAFSWVYLSPSPLPFAHPLSLPICKDISDNHFAFLHFFFFGMVLVTASWTVLQTSVHSSSGTLSTSSNSLNHLSITILDY